MANSSYGLRKGPWAVAYTAGGGSNPGFSFVSPAEYGADPEVVVHNGFMYAMNFAADGAVGACIEAGKAFNRAGIKGAPDVDSIKRMLGVEK